MTTPTTGLAGHSYPHPHPPPCPTEEEPTEEEPTEEGALGPLPTADAYVKSQWPMTELTRIEAAMHRSTTHRVIMYRESHACIEASRIE
jgi:hypothetical protein